jgi:hypothetical protein
MGAFFPGSEMGKKSKGDVGITMKKFALALVVLALVVLACRKEPWPPQTTNALGIKTPNALVVKTSLIVIPIPTPPRHVRCISVEWEREYQRKLCKSAMSYLLQSTRAIWK